MPRGYIYISDLVAAEKMGYIGIKGSFNSIYGDVERPRTHPWVNIA